MQHAIQTKGIQSSLSSRGGAGRTFACGTIKAGVTTACVAGGFIGGSYIGSFVEESTGNPLLGIIAKYATVATSAVVANAINKKIESTLNPVQPLFIEAQVAKPVVVESNLDDELAAYENDVAKLFDVVDEDSGRCPIEGL